MGEDNSPLREIQKVKDVTPGLKRDALIVQMANLYGANAVEACLGERKGMVNEARKRVRRAGLY